LEKEKERARSAVWLTAADKVLNNTCACDHAAKLCCYVQVALHVHANTVPPRASGRGTHTHTHTLKTPMFNGCVTANTKTVRYHQHTQRGAPWVGAPVPNHHITLSMKLALCLTWVTPGTLGSPRASGSQSSNRRRIVSIVTRPATSAARPHTTHLTHGHGPCLDFSRRQCDVAAGSSYPRLKVPPPDWEEQFRFSHQSGE
jgi:hypothetical protein